MARQSADFDPDAGHGVTPQNHSTAAVASECLPRQIVASVNICAFKKFDHANELVPRITGQGESNQSGGTMEIKKTAIGVLGGAAVGFGLLLAAPTATADENTPPDNWGQEVKLCNLTSCYPGGVSRGEYVREQARDNQGPGYGYEIHDEANPGKSNPNPGNPDKP
ncbi:hypothetical protein [Mycobacterium sp. ITM-2016-00318]|uniref:hypothetical protein n=1 Tax=Mycobacterium sp. ITM-2016-00318 TaxID=2099693 RepID=UPI001E2A422A|nr:hypothetical protein [Mycobacterium sp. ITM-2016-00318]WNG90999.1 hypothetical protein C6A82_015830 [Mycobacterium sp. ITM-2016-00318]